MSHSMTKYLKASLEEGEHPIAARRLHAIFMLNGIFWFAALAAMGWAFDFVIWSYLGAFVPTNEFKIGAFSFSLAPGWIGWFFTISGSAIFMMEFLRYTTTYIVVTTKRIIVKRGWINVRLDQTDLSDVKGVHVDQGWLGRFLDYGSVVLDCRFVKDVSFPYVPKAYEIVSAIQKMKTKVEEHLAGIDEHAQANHGAQTIININSVPLDGRTVIERGDERIVIESARNLHASHPKQLSSDILHDEILEDFKKTH